MKENMEDRQMLDKKTLTFRVIAGLALLYVGGNLIFSSVKEQPEYYVIYALAGAAFALLGLAWGGLAVKKLATHDYKEMMDDDADEMERALKAAEKETASAGEENAADTADAAKENEEE